MFSLLAARRGCFRRRGRPFPATAPAAFARHRLAGGGGFNSPARSGDGGSSACPQTRARACAGATASRGSAHSDAPRDRTRPRSGDTTPGPSAPSVRRRTASDGLDPVDRAVACRSQTGGAWPEQEEDDPIVPPAEDFQGLAGHQGVVVHPRAERSQAAFATQRVVAAQQDRPGGGEGGDEGSRQDHAEGVEGPGGVAAEAMEATPVSWADAAGGEEALGDEASAAGQDPAGDQFDEGPERGRGENGVEVMQQEKEGGVDPRVGFLASGSLGR